MTVFEDVIKSYLNDKARTLELCKQNLQKLNLHDGDQFVPVRTHDELCAVVHVINENEELTLNTFFWVVVLALLSARDKTEFDKMFGFSRTFYDYLTKKMN